VTVVLFIEVKPSIAKDAVIPRETLFGCIEGHADPFTLVEVLAFFMAFPGPFAYGNKAECALENLLKILGWSWMDVVVNLVV
jgi:hypothetical protein